MKPASVRIQTSAGGVVYRLTPKGPEVAMISVKRGNVWTLPKGAVDEGEKLEETALREVSEETGLKAELVGRLGEITYWYYLSEEKARCKKTVHFYLMRHTGGSTRRHDQEVDNAAWFPIKKAIGVTTYKGDREMLERAEELLKERDIGNGQGTGPSGA